MPTFDYECPNGHRLTDFEPMSAPTERLCPECPQPPQPPFEWHENEDEPFCTCEPVMPIMMKRVIGSGGGVIWKGGPPTQKFHR